MTAGRDARPAPDAGRILLEFPRTDGTLRWALRSHEGHDYLEVRLWTRGVDGKHYPTAKGATVRVRELRAVVAALAAAADELGAPEPEKPRDENTAWLDRFDARRRRAEGTTER